MFKQAILTFIETLTANLLFPPLVNLISFIEESTKHVVRLYTVEGKQLSRKEGTRCTWFTQPEVALEIGHYMGSTGRLVYVDLEINLLSDFTYRFYSATSQSYVLKGDLMRIAKGRWKYVRGSDKAGLA